MPKFELKTASAEDIPALKAIWSRVFGDPEEYIEGYFEDMYEDGQAVAALSGGSLVGSAYALPLGELVWPGGRERCAVGYAFAVLPEYRGLGIGRALTDRVIEKLRDEGFGAVCIYPAERSLFDYYRPSGYGEFFYKEEYRVKAEEVVPVSDDGRIWETDSEEYAAARESFLAGRCHISFDRKRLEYQRRLCMMSGGGMYSIDCGGVRGCAAAECFEGRAYVKELLIDREKRDDALALLHSRLGAAEYSLRVPGEGEPCAMLVSPFEDRGTGRPWYGLPFD